MRFVDFHEQYHCYKQDIHRAIDRVLEHGQYIMGPEVQELEAKLAQQVGTRFCLSAASGTDALVMALLALGVGPGDEVITVPFTFYATAEVIAFIGARPVFVDIDADTYTIDVSQVEAAITPKTKAILPVSLFGQMADYTRLNAIAAKHGLPVIEDAAQSLGATQHGKQSCGVTTIGCTSFFPTKPLGCYGDGGAIFTSDEKLAETMRKLRTHGSLKRDHYELVGMTGRLDTLQAAILLAKLPHFEAEIAARQRIAARYSELLAECCQVPVVKPGNTHVYGSYTIASDERDRICSRLTAEGIPFMIYYTKCLHEQPVFAHLGYKHGDFPTAEKATQRVFSLPMHPWLTEQQQDQIVASIQESMVTAAV